MTQYDELVQYQRNKLEAEEWAKGIKQLHVFDAATTNMWYEEHPEDGRVTDVEYNDGRIERSKDGNVIRIMGEQLTGKELIDAWSKASYVAGA
tara:strand:+ start:1825 stop:2103 length:279 start_codon:yes stop_codon:yes gene_type:complete